jgi:antitoxin component of MazEF toxin-antitoxin module
MIMELPSIEKRSIIRVGDSLAVTIPPAWLRQKGLVVGDDVIVIADNELTINKVTKEKVAELHKAMEGKK